jgi:hypothetical protein
MNNMLHRRNRGHGSIGLLAIATAVAVSACSTGGEATGTTGQALSARRSGFVWSYNATSTYTANSAFQSDSNIVINHLTTGHYLVAFPNIGGDLGGNVQVTTYGGGNQRCKVQDWWSVGTTLDVAVACFTPTATAVDSLFTASYVSRNDAPGTEGGYVWAFAPVNPSYDAASARAWNSTGGSITIQRTGVGTYAVTFAGQGFVGGTVEVSAQGMDSNYCESSGWWPTGADQTVNVSCFSSGGAPSDSMFALAFTQGSPNGGASFAYAWASDPWTTTNYTPDTTYQGGALLTDCGSTNPTPAPVSIARQSTGVYTVNFPGMPFSDNPSDVFMQSNVKVTAYGWSGEYCSVSYWTGDSASASASVVCFDVSGNPIDSYFTVTYSSSYDRIC